MADAGGKKWPLSFGWSSTALEVIGNRSLSGTRAVVTGSTSGIGKEVARALALRGAAVILACRSSTLGEELKAEILRDKADADVEIWHLDLVHLKSVVTFADKFKGSGYPLNILVLNAGVVTPNHVVTDDGFEQQFQVNHLSQFYLLQLLLPILKASKPSRVVFVSSGSHRDPGVTLETFDEEHLNLMHPSDYGGLGLPQYGTTKLCQVLIARFIAENFKEEGLTAYSVHPGTMIATNIGRSSLLFKIAMFLMRPFTKNTSQGAATPVLCAVAPEAEDWSGEFFSNCRPIQMSPLARNPELPKKVWDISEKLLKDWEGRMREEEVLKDSPLQGTGDS